MRPAGQPPSFPVGPGPGGAGSGQNRDKTGSPFGTTFAVLGVLLLLGMTATGGADDRQARHDRTLDDVRRIVAEFHALLPRVGASAVGAAYARYSSKYQDSVADQLRAIFADAARKSVFIPLENVFFDLAVRGVKNDREGLNGLRACLDRKAAGVVFFFATNRLFRKTYRALQFVEEQVVEKGIRAVFVKSGIDTANGKMWRQMLTHNAGMDEFVVGMYVDNIRAAHEGLLARRLVFGTVSFGYAGVPTDGPPTRRGLARRRLAIDPSAGPVVVRVFGWYVADRLPIAEIVRRLNADPGVPPPPKSPDGGWTGGAVRTLLRNPRYRGQWRYGATETVWVSSKDYARQVPRPEPLKDLQIEDLRLVPNDRWFAAQGFLAEDAGKAAGRKPVDPDRAARPRVLNGLFYCPAHDRKLSVAGVYGGYMACAECARMPAAERPLFSQLPRGLALRKTCDELAALLRADAGLTAAVVECCRRAAAELQAPDPAGAAASCGRRDKLDRRIAFVLRNPGDTDADQAESEAELRRMRRDRAALQAEIDAAASAASRVVAVPTPEEVRVLIDGMAGVLATAATEAGVEQAGRVRALIDLLTGGRIDLVQAGERRTRGGWLLGRFRVSVIDAVAAELGGRPVTGPEAAGVEIEYRDDGGADPTVAGRVKELYDRGLMLKQIARELVLPRSRVAAALDAWFAAAGRDRPDGRTRRAGLADKHVDPPAYRAAAERVKALADAGKLFGEIAAETGLDRNTVTAAWRYWHESRGKPVPDGRSRRKTLPTKSRPPRPIDPP